MELIFEEKVWVCEYTYKFIRQAPSHSGNKVDRVVDSVLLSATYQCKVYWTSKPGVLYVVCYFDSEDVDFEVDQQITLELHRGTKSEAIRRGIDLSDRYKAKVLAAIPPEKTDEEMLAAAEAAAENDPINFKGTLKW